MLGTRSIPADVIERVRHKWAEQGYKADALLHVPSIVGKQYPPATEAQLQATESRLGFALPADLRHLYTHLANGGFGPGAGVLGVSEGYRWHGLGGNLEEAYLGYCSGDTEVDYRTHQKDAGTFLIPVLAYDRTLLPLCDLGCCNTTYYDRERGIILVGAPADDYVLTVQANSLTEWLEKALEGSLQTY